MKEKRGLHPKANLRDNMSLSELAYTMASEALAAERIEHQRSSGSWSARMRRNKHLGSGPINLE